MRWTLIFVLAFVSVTSAQQTPSRTPPPGSDISARDSDRIVVENDAHIQIVRRRQATIRTIFNQEERVLIVLVDYSKPGEFPDGQVDWAFNFYQVEGAWPLEQRWEALTAIFQYEGERSRPRGLGFETPRGLVQLVPGSPASTPDPRAVIVLSHGGSSGGPRRAVSFAEAETLQLADAARSKASGATVSTLMGPAGSGVTGTGTASASVTPGTAAVSVGIRGPNGAPRTIRNVAPQSTTGPQQIRTPPPAGQEIAANDGDRVIVVDDAQVQIIRRRQAMLRTIFRQEQRLLIVLADYAQPGQFPDGEVDSTFNFYELEGNWPLAPRWEALTTMFQYEGDPQFPTRYALATPEGLVHLSPGRPGIRKPDPTAIADVWFRGSSIGLRSGLSFAEAEQLQLAEAAKRRNAPTSSSAAPASPQ